MSAHCEADAQILQLQNYIDTSSCTVAITGAGISVSAGENA